MWISDRAARLVAAGTCISALVAASLAIDRYAGAHFLPEQKMRQALSAGDDCFLILGDSRMVAALDPGALHRSLAQGGGDRCVADLSMGAMDITGAAVTGREYLSHGRRPRAVVVGKAGDSLLGTSPPLGPGEMVGNNAVHLIWTRPADVFLEVPGFPMASLDAFNSGFRFLAMRATPLGRYQHLASIGVQRLDHALTGRPAQSSTRFGAPDAMASLEARLRAGANARLSAAMEGPESERLSPWFVRLEALAAAAGAPVVVVELPMPGVYRRAVTAMPGSMAYSRWLADRLAARGGAFVDLDRELNVGDESFLDALHVTSEAAAQLSTRLGAFLASFTAR